MNPVYLRLLEIADDLGQPSPVPNTFFQELLSLSSGRISQISDPLSMAKIGPKGLSNLANLGYNPAWVNDGPPHKKRLLPSSDTRNDAVGAQSRSNVGAGPDVRGRIPLISWVQAGMWSEAVDIYEPGYAERWLPFLKNNRESTFALRVVGDSMTSRFGKSYPEGCIIFVDPENRTPENGDRIIAKLQDTQEVTFKVFTKDAGRCWLRPLNDSHPPIYDAFSVVGKVIGKWEDD